MDTYGLVVGLVAVVAGGQVSHRRDGEAAALTGVRVLLAAVVAQALEQAADHVLVVADEVGVLAEVVAVPGQGGDRVKGCSRSVLVNEREASSSLLVDAGDLFREAGFLGGQVGDHLPCDGRSTDSVFVQHGRTTHVPWNTHRLSAHPSYCMSSHWLPLLTVRAEACVSNSSIITRLHAFNNVV